MSTANLEQYKKQLALNPQDIPALTQLFNHYYEQHDFQQAEAYLHKIDALDTTNVDVKFLLGVTCQFQNRLQEAISWYLRTIALYPNHIPAFCNLGQIYMLQNQLREATDAFERAIEINPDGIDTAFAYNHLGVIAIEQQQLDKAEAYFGKAIQLQPDNVQFQINLAHSFLTKKEYKNAMTIIEQIPDNEAYRLDKQLELAKIYQATNDTQKAIDCLVELGKDYPTDARIDHLLGNLLVTTNQSNLADQYYLNALQKDPAHIEVIVKRVHQALEQGDTPKAKSYLEHILALYPGHADTYANLAYICLMEGNPEGAIHCCDICLSIDPNNISGLRFMGHAYQLKQDSESAAKYLLHALELKPDDADLMGHLGSIHKGINATRLPRQLCYNSITSLVQQYEQRQTDADPIYFTAGQATALAQYAYNCCMNCLWDEFEAIQPILDIVTRDQLAENVSLGVSPFISQFTLSPSIQTMIHQRLADRNKAPEHLRFNDHPKQIDGKMKIGYISPDFNGHVVGFMVQDFLQHHDHRCFEIYAYSLNNVYDEVRTRIENAVDHFKDISNMPVPDAAKLIYEDGIHILVDLAGYTTGSKPAILGYQPAAVQAHFIGWAGSMASDFIQYHINTHDLIPESQLAFYKEQIVYLPESPIAVERYALPKKLPAHEEYQLPTDKFIFACFNNSYRIDRAIFSAWMKILKAVPDSILWLNYFVEETTENLKLAAERYGIAKERLIFRPFKKLNDDWHHLLADLYLDTPLVSGGTTTLLSAYGGLPVLCVQGDTPQSRYGSGLMAACGMQELNCNTMEEYTQKAIRLAQHPDELETIRKKLKDNVNTSTLFDPKRWTQQLEKAYTLMWDDHCQDHPNRSIDVP